MNVVLVKNLADISDYNPKAAANEPIFTRDGGKLVTLRLVGGSVSECITEAIAAVVSALPDKYDSTVYLFNGSISMSAHEVNMSMVLGVSGVSDLDVTLRTVLKSGQIKSSDRLLEASQPDLPFEHDKNMEVDKSEEDAVIVAEETPPNV